MSSEDRLLFVGVGLPGLLALTCIWGSLALILSNLALNSALASSELSNADKPVKNLSSAKKVISKDDASDCITLLLDISPLFTDLLESDRLDIIDLNSEPVEVEDPDGFTKVIKTNRKKKILY